MKTKIYLIAAILLITGALFTIIKSYNNAPITIGYLGNLSGKLSNMGVVARNGIQVAIDEINSADGIKGRKVILKVIDHQGEPENIPAAINEFQNSGVKIVIGPLISNMAMPVIQAIADKDIFVMSPTVSTDQVSDRDDNFFRTTEVAKGQATGLANYIIKQGYKKIGIIYDIGNSAYSKPLAEEIDQMIRISEGEIVYLDSFAKKTDTDFEKIAGEIIQKKPDALVMIASGIDAAQLAQQIRKYNDKIQFFGSSWVKTNDFTKHGGKATEGSILISIYESKIKTENYQKFEKSYSDKFKVAPTFIPVYAYDATKVVLEAMLNSDANNIENIRTWIVKKSEFQSLEGKIKINRFGDSERGHTLFQIRDGKYFIMNQ